MQRFSLILAAVLLSASASFVGAQVQTENRSVTGRPDTDVQIGVYVNGTRTALVVRSRQFS